MSAKIIKGEDRSLTVSLKDENGAALDLTSYSTITATFCKADGTTFTSTGTASAPVSGKVVFAIPRTDTATMDTGTQGFTIDLDDTTNLRKVNLSNSIVVEEAIC